MTHNLKEIYEDYCKVNGDIDKALFTDICHQFNIMIMDYILEGKEFNMGNNLSTISITRRDRDPRSPRIDWGESNKYKKELLDEGKLIHLLKTDDLSYLKFKKQN